MPRSKYSAEEKLEFITTFQQEDLSIQRFISKYSVSVTRQIFGHWLDCYNRDGFDGLKESKKWKHYSVELKQQAVNDYLSGKGSFRSIANKYGLRSKRQVQVWVSKYNGIKKLTATPSRKQVPIMARKTTFDERVKITEYALAHDRNYTETATKFQVSYQQVRSWVLKVDQGGFPALKDRRGHHKAPSELDEVDQLKLEVRRLKAELNDKKAIEAFAKKLLALKRKP